MKHHAPILLALLLGLSACEKQPTASATDSTPAAAADVSLDAWFTTTAPAAPETIHKLRETAKPGDEIVLSGLVMGREQPFVDGRAAFVLGDPEILTPCNRMPDDECTTPWDACCDSKEDKLQGTATIQLVDENDRVLKTSIKGSHGLTELSLVTLTGVVAKSSTPEALIINATKLHIAPQPE